LKGLAVQLDARVAVQLAVQLTVQLAVQLAWDAKGKTSRKTACENYGKTKEPMNLKP